jgi:hypothetical protein
MKNRPAEVKRIITKPGSGHSVDTTGGEQEEEQEVTEMPVESTDFDDAESEFSEQVPEVENERNNEEDDEVVEADEAEETDSLDDLTDDPAAIRIRMSNLDDCQIGHYPNFVIPFGRLTEATNKIRSTKHPYDSDDRDRMNQFVNTDAHHEIFNCFKGIYEFIFHVHNVFEVKLKQDIPDDEDQVLRILLEDTCGKYNN